MVVVQETEKAVLQKPLTPSEFITLVQGGKPIPEGTVVDVLGIYRTAEEIINRTQLNRSSAPKSWFD